MGLYGLISGERTITVGGGTTDHDGATDTAGDTITETENEIDNVDDASETDSRAKPRPTRRIRAKPTPTPHLSLPTPARLFSARVLVVGSSSTQIVSNTDNFSSSETDTDGDSGTATETIVGRSRIPTRIPTARPTRSLSYDGERRHRDRFRIRDHHNWRRLAPSRRQPNRAAMATTTSSHGHDDRDRHR